MKQYKGKEKYSVRDSVRAGASFSEQLDDIAAGKITNRRQSIEISDTPFVLEKLGAEQLPVVVTHGTIEKATEGKHGISFETLKQLPEQLADPVMVFDSATEADSLVVMTELKQDGKTIVAAVQLSKGMGNNIVNDIVSIHPRSNEYHFINWINQGLLRYMNKSKSRAWSLASGLQLPRVSGSKLGFKNKILFDYDIVKGKYATTQQGTFQLPALSEVQEIFKGQDVRQTKDGFTVNLPTGKGVLIQSVDQITPDKVALNIGYSKTNLSENEVIAGKYKNGKIELVKGAADKWTLAHEQTHWLEDLNILRPLDVAALRGHIKRLTREGKFQTQNKEDIGGSEDRANFIADALTAPQKGSIKRTFDRIQDFIDKLINLVHRTTRGVVRDIRTGEIYNERPTIGGALRDIHDEEGVETGRYAIKKIGYNTHGYWAPSKEIYEIEKERGNVIDKQLLKSGHEAIWVTEKPEDAARYNRLADDWWDEATQDEIDALEKIDLTGAIHIESMDDGDGGELWIRKIGTGKNIDQYSIRQQTDPPVSSDPKVLNKYLREETLSIAQKIQDELFAAGRKVQKEFQPKNMTMRELILKSPEFFDHPEMKRIVGLFAFDKDEIKHEMFNDFNAADKMGPEETVTEAAQTLKRKGLSLFDRLSGKESKEYKQLGELIDLGDTEWVHKATNKSVAERQKLFKEWAAKNGYTEDTIKVWQLYMDSGEKSLNVQTAQLRGMIADIIEEAYFKGETPDLNELKQTLKGALAEMETWKGFYAPRIRERGDWMVQAFKKHGPLLEVNKEFYRNHRTSELAAQRLARSLEKEGWTIYSPELTKLKQKKSRGEKVTPEELHNARVGQVEKLPEGIYQDQNSVATAKLIDAAIDKMKSDDTSEFKTEVLRAVADEIKARGARAHMIHRKEGFVIRGFIEDTIERHLIYWSQIAGGASKARVAKQAYQILLGQDGNPGIDPIKEKLEYETATDYIRNQLRNADAYDRMIGLAKSIATFKFLGFNLRSLAVNTTAVGTTAPGAVHQYALDGKGSMFRVMNELARSGKDYGHLMTAKFLKTGWKLSNADEQKFIDECHKKGYDDAQYVREAKGTMGKIHSRVWSTMMDWSMYAFGVSEKWNRGTTMLAAYRLARKNGATHE
ncbi:MAG: hypothetical protein PHN89_04370, partial [Candidatus Pacebacteria bacterium]|nr:hypothetical protein [Candidatus Paceibacterota bacterium]